MTATTAELNTILKQAFLECFQQWWKKCMESQVDYFEGDQVSSTPDMPAFLPARKSDTFLTDLVHTVTKALRKRSMFSVFYFYTFKS